MTALPDLFAPPPAPAPVLGTPVSDDALDAVAEAWVSGQRMTPEEHDAMAAVIAAGQIRQLMPRILVRARAKAADKPS